MNRKRRLEGFSLLNNRRNYTVENKQTWERYEFSVVWTKICWAMLDVWKITDTLPASTKENTTTTRRKTKNWTAF